LPSELPPKAKSVPQQQLYLVSAMPGIGRKLAEKLLSKYGTPRRIMGLTAGELAMTQGIGWRKAEKIRNMMDATFSRHQQGAAQARLETE